MTYEHVKQSKWNVEFPGLQRKGSNALKTPFQIIELKIIPKAQQLDTLAKWKEARSFENDQSYVFDAFYFLEEGLIHHALKIFRVFLINYENVQYK